MSEHPTGQGILIVRRERNVAQGTGALLSPNDWQLGGTFSDKVVLTMYQVTGTKGWNGKNQYIQLATGISYKTADKTIVTCDHEAIGNKAVAFVGTSGVQMGWLASQADMLAEDWMFVD